MPARGRKLRAPAPRAAGVPATYICQGLNASTGTYVFPVTAPTGAGDTLLVEILCNQNGSAVSNVTDSKGNVYTLLGSYTANTPNRWAFYSPGASGGPGGGPTAALTTSDTMTISAAVKAMTTNIMAVNVPGVGQLDQMTSQGVQTSASSGLVSNFNQAHDIGVSLAGWQNTGGAGSWSAPYTQADQQVNNFSFASGYLLDTGTNTSQAVTFNAAVACNIGHSFYTFRNVPAPYLVGTAATTGATTTLTPSSPLAAGDVLALAIGNGTLAATISSVTDTQGGVWTIQPNQQNSAGRQAGWATRAPGSALGTSDTITLVMSGGAPRMIAIGVPAQPGYTTVVDLAPPPTGANTANTTFNCATGAMNYAGEICLGVVCASGTPAASAESWTRIASAGTSPIVFAYQIQPGGTATQTCSGTLSASSQWGEALLTFGYLPNVTGTGALAAKKIGLAGSGTVSLPAITGTGAFKAKKIGLAGSGTASPPPITGTGAFSAKKIKLAGSGTFTPPAPVTGTGAFTAKKIAISGAGTFGSGVVATGAFHAKKIALAGAGSYAPGITGTGAFHAKKISLAGTGTSGPITGITGTGAFAAKKIQLQGDGGPVVVVPLAALPDAALIPVILSGVNLNEGDRDDGLFVAVTNVDGWYGTPGLAGNDLVRALTDGAVWGTKIVAARSVAISGAALGPRGPLLAFARDLAVLAVAGSPAALEITEADDSDQPPILTAQVRADTDALTLAWVNPTTFTWQLVVTAADPRLYEDTTREVTLTPAGTGGTGRTYPFTEPRAYATADIPNQAQMDNPGEIGAPVTATYTGPLGASQLTDGASSILLRALIAGEVVYLNTETLAASAPGGATRASYVLAGSQPLLVPPGGASWSLYATGSGDVTLDWAGTWV